MDYGYQLVVGFPAVGHCEWSGAFPRREVSPDEKCDIFEGAAANNEELLAKTKPGKDDDTILEKSMLDARRGFASQPMELKKF